MRILVKIIVIIIFTQFACQTISTKSYSTNLDQTLEKFLNPNSSSVLVAAHRAQHTKFPENSLEGIRHSIESGVDIIEIDVRRTKDGKLVLMHDSRVDRTTNGKGYLIDFTFEQLQKLELDKNENDSLVHNVPLLENALNIAKGKIMIDLDIKDTFIKPLVEIIHRSGTKNQVIFFDSDYSMLDSLILVDSSLMIMPRARSSKDVDEILIRYNPKVIHIDYGFFTKQVVAKIKRSGARIWINALGIPDSIASSGKVGLGYSPLVSGGANILQTDFPEILINYIRDLKIN